MRPLILALSAICAGTLLCQQPSFRPSTLEAYIQQPNVRMISSAEVGRLVSAEAHAIVAVIITEDTRIPTVKVAGVKIELGNRNGIDYVYLSEEQIPSLIETLKSLDTGVEAFRNKPSPTPYRHMGSGLLRQSNPPFIHTLSASYYVAPDSSGLLLSAFKGERYRFPDRRPVELAVYFSRALEQMKSQ